VASTRIVYTEIVAEMSTLSVSQAMDCCHLKDLPESVYSVSDLKILMPMVARSNAVFGSRVIVARTITAVCYSAGWHRVSPHRESGEDLCQFCVLITGSYCYLLARREMGGA
jgi:hypothetical protein